MTHRAILAIAVPIMISNVSTPLLGVVDTAVMGRMPDPAYIGAVALGALVFNFVFWGFGFLRMGTTGLPRRRSAQPMRTRSARAWDARCSSLLVVGAGIGGCCNGRFARSLSRLLDGSPGSRRWRAITTTYGSGQHPRRLINYALLGWFIGLGRARVALALAARPQHHQRALDVLFVLGLGMGVRGVALGTLLAEVIAAAVGLADRRFASAATWADTGTLRG